MRIRQQRSPQFVILLIALYTGAVGSFLYFLLNGWQYYTLPLALRIRNPLYNQLKPGGIHGHFFGILGSSMLILMLSYSARKRLRFMSNWGTLPRWLDIHIFFGLVGPLFIILHSTFKLNGLVAISFWSMIAVALSGIVGRFLYLQIPRNIKGAELTLEDVKKLKRQINDQLQQYAPADTDITEYIKKRLISQTDNKANFGILIWRIVQSGFLLRFRRQHIARHFSKRFGLPPEQMRELIVLILQRDLLERRIALWTHIHRYFHYWHVFHKPFAILMYLIMFIHVGIAIWLGYQWIL